jgi:hypothetical protein
MHGSLLVHLVAVVHLPQLHLLKRWFVKQMVAVLAMIASLQNLVRTQMLKF